MAAPTDPVLHIVLYQPEIPPNTGNVGRLCLGIGARLHVVHPIAFSLSEKAVRRAGLDYWKHVDLQEHASAEDFWRWSEGRTVHLYSSRGQGPYTTPRYRRGDVLVFGCETRGLPQEEVDARGAWTIPMKGRVRSLNLSNAAAVVAYHALQQVEPALFEAT